MLIDKKIEKGDIVTLKLVSGDELVAKFESDENDKLTIAKPIAIGISPQGIIFTSFMVAAPDDSKMVFEKRNVLTYFRARDEIKNAYIQNTSNIVAASSVPQDNNLGQ